MSLSEDANGCHLGGFTLSHDGTAVGEDQGGLTWWSTGWTLSVCDRGDKAYCFVECYAVEPSGVAN